MKALLRPFSTLSLTLAALAAGTFPLPAQVSGQEVTQGSASVPEGAGSAVTVPETAGEAGEAVSAGDPAVSGSSADGVAAEPEAPALSVPEALRALWTAGGATDFSG